MLSELEFYQLSSVGDRAENQDCMTSKLENDYALFIVADGLGGHHAGEKASSYFCHGMVRQATKYQKVLQNAELRKTKKIMKAWVSAAVSDMATLFSDDEYAADAHTTCVVLYIDDNRVVTAHCGDSRIYRLNQEQVIWRTKDHSLIQKQLDEGKITEAEMGLHPEQNQLTRSINIESQHQTEIGVYPAVKKGETFLLCSDGFWEFIKEKDLLQLAAPGVGKAELKKTAKMMHIRAQGKGDNLTVQWVRCG